jgi:hypothetical protein
LTQCINVKGVRPVVELVRAEKNYYIGKDINGEEYYVEHLAAARIGDFVVIDSTVDFYYQPIAFVRGY